MEVRAGAHSRRRRAGWRRRRRRGRGRPPRSRACGSTALPSRDRDRCATRSRSHARRRSSPVSIDRPRARLRTPPDCDDVILRPSPSLSSFEQTAASFDRLRALRREGVVGADTLVWTEGMRARTRVEDLPSLLAALDRETAADDDDDDEKPSAAATAAANGETSETITRELLNELRGAKEELRMSRRVSASARERVPKTPPPPPPPPSSSTTPRRRRPWDPPRRRAPGTGEDKHGDVLSMLDACASARRDAATQTAVAWSELTTRAGERRGGTRTRSARARRRVETFGRRRGDARVGVAGARRAVVLILRERGRRRRRGGGG